MRTIKQLADELGVSKTAVRKYMTPAFREKHTQTMSGNIIGIDDEGCKKIAETIKKPPEIPANPLPETEKPENDDILAVLKATIDTLQQQLAVKDAQIADLTQANKAMAQSINADRHNELAGTLQQSLTAGEGPSEPSGGPVSDGGLFRWPFSRKNRKS